jgi:hypothetical protein
MTTQKTLSFGAKTKSGIEISFFAWTNKGEIKIGARTTNYEHKDAGHFRNDPREGWIYVLDNQFINEKLINYNKHGAVKVPDYNVQEIEEIKTEFKNLFNIEIEKEIESLEDTNEITLSWMTTGYGSAASLKHKKLSFEASKKFEDNVKFIKESKLIDFVNTDPFADYGLTLEAKLTYKEFKNLMKQVDLLRSEKQRIDDETKLQKQQEQQKIEEEELLIWDAGIIYASAGNKMLHSMGAKLSEKENKITVYTTNSAKKIPNAVTTYSIKEELKNQGFKFNADTKNWEIEMSDEGARKTLDILKKHDTKIWPSKLGMVKCWECGTYFSPKKGDHDGSDYYCGC